MTATVIAPTAEIINLSISWETYETLLEELNNRRLWLTLQNMNLLKKFSVVLWKLSQKN